MQIENVENSVIKQEPDEDSFFSYSSSRRHNARNWQIRHQSYSNRKVGKYDKTVFGKDIEYTGSKWVERESIC